MRLRRTDRGSAPRSVSGAAPADRRRGLAGSGRVWPSPPGKARLLLDPRDLRRVGTFAILWRWPALTVLGPAGGLPGDPAQRGLRRGRQRAAVHRSPAVLKTFSRISLLTLVARPRLRSRGRWSTPRAGLRSRRCCWSPLMGFWYVATVWLGGSAVTSAINQDARFALLFVLAFVIGAWAGEQLRLEARVHPGDAAGCSRPWR